MFSGLTICTFESEKERCGRASSKGLRFSNAFAAGEWEEDAAGTKIHPGFSLVKKKVLELGGEEVLA